MISGPGKMLLTEDGSFISWLIHKSTVRIWDVLRHEDRAKRARARDALNVRRGEGYPWTWIRQREMTSNWHFNQISLAPGQKCNYIWVIFMVIGMLANAWDMTLQAKDSQFVLRRCVDMSEWGRRGPLIMPFIKLTSHHVLDICTGKYFFSSSLPS